MIRNYWVISIPQDFVSSGTCQYLETLPKYKSRAHLLEQALITRKNVSVHEQVMPNSQSADQPTAQWGRDTEQVLSQQN